MNEKDETPGSGPGIKNNGNSRIKKWVVRTLAFLIIVAGLAYGADLFVHSLSHESTDNAYVSGMVVPVSPEVRGNVVKVYVTDNQNVEAGSRLVEISPVDYSDAVEKSSQNVSTLTAEKAELEAACTERTKALSQARANLAASVAEEALAEKEAKRATRLADQEAASRSQYDTAEARWKVATARKEAATSAVAQAEGALEVAQAKLKTQAFRIQEAETSHKLVELNLQRTVIFAPVSGRIAQKNVDPGKYVQPGQPLLSIVQPDTWVVANFKETQIGKMSVGQPVEITVDAYGGKTFKGHIDSLQPGTGAVFSLLPPENATGNFVKVVQRVPVKIVIDSPFDPVHPLWPGLSVIATVDISAQSGPKLSVK